MIRALFLDVGGVLMTNGWDHHAREAAIQHFNLDGDEFEKRHREYYPLHEKDEMPLDEYIRLSVFWKHQPFSLLDFKEFIYAQSRPFGEVIEFYKDIKRKFDLKIVIISNEGRDLTDYRISLAHLDQLADIYFASCYVKVRKPDPFIYELALDSALIPIEEIIYIDDRDYLVGAAAKLGISGIVNRQFEYTKQRLLSLLNAK